MIEFDFSLRLARLRLQKGVSARDMSLSLGQNPNYINSIESGKALPSMTNFYYICDYLGVTPQEFFSDGTASPETIRQIMVQLCKLPSDQVEAVAIVVRAMAEK